MLLVAAGAALLLAAAAPDVSGGGPGASGNPDHLVRMFLYAAVALVFSFLCSVAEAVLLSVTPAYLAALDAGGGSQSARLLSKAKTNIDRSLAGILTLNTIAHTLGAGGAGAEAAIYFGEQHVGLIMAVLTLLILFLSEIVPKTLGAVYWRRLAPATAWLVQTLIILLYPLIWVSEKLTRLITRGKDLHILSREEIAAMAEVGADHGQLDARESRILRNLFRFPELRALDIMTPRTVVFALPQSLTVAEVLRDHPDPPFSRIPVYERDIDHVTGFVLKTDILLARLQGRGSAKLADLAREVRAVSQRASLERVTDELLDNRVHLVLALDAHGGLGGVVTLEDVVETLIGAEIVDEADKIEDMRELARRKWRERIQRLGIDVSALDPALAPRDDEDAER